MTALAGGRLLASSGSRRTTTTEIAGTFPDRPDFHCFTLHTSSNIMSGRKRAATKATTPTATSDGEEEHGHETFKTVEDLKAKIARELAALSKTASAKAVNNSEADELQERLQKDAAEHSKLLEKAVSLGKHFEEEAEADKAKLKETLARLAKEKAEDDAAAKAMSKAMDGTLARLGDLKRRYAQPA